MRYFKLLGFHTGFLFLLAACSPPPNISPSPMSPAPLPTSVFPQCAMDPWEQTSVTPPVTHRNALSSFIISRNTEKLGYLSAPSIETDETNGGANYLHRDYVRTRLQAFSGTNRALLDDTLSAEEIGGASTIPATFDLRDDVPQCANNINTNYNQGQCGSCWAHSTAAGIANGACIQWARKNPGAVPTELQNLVLSPQFTMDCGTPHEMNDKGETQLFGCQGGFMSTAYDFAKRGIPSLACRPGLFETSEAGALSCSGSCGCLRCGCQIGVDHALAMNDSFTLFSDRNQHVFTGIENPQPDKIGQCFDPLSGVSSTIANEPCRYCQERCENIAQPWKAYRVANVYGLEDDDVAAASAATNPDPTKAIAAMQQAIRQYGSLNIGIDVPLSFSMYKNGIYRYTGWVVFSSDQPIACGTSAVAINGCENAAPQNVINLVSELNQGKSTPVVSYACVDSTTHLPVATGGQGVCAITDAIEGGHALRVVGWGTDPTHNNELYWIIANSWGTAWGDKGFFNMAATGTTALLVQWDEVTWAEIDLSNIGN